MVNLNKISKMEVACFLNGLRLHIDSIYLFKKRSYPSSFFISILSQEEFGKMYRLGDFVWNSNINGRLDSEEEIKYLNLVYNHINKQVSFKINSWDFNYNKKSFKILKDIGSGKLDALKQNAMYVGLKRKGKKIDINSKIIIPARLNRKIVEKQITIINDFLLMLIVGVRKGYYTYDNEIVEKKLNKILFKKLMNIWKTRGYRTKQKLKNLDF